MLTLSSIVMVLERCKNASAIDPHEGKYTALLFGGDGAVGFFITISISFQIIINFPKCYE